MNDSKEVLWKKSSGDAFTRSVAEVLEGLRSSEAGLSRDEALQRLREFGENALPESRKTSALRRFLGHFNDTLIFVLIAAAGITALMQHWVDTGVILAVVVINAVIGFIQEGKAEKALEGIRNMLSPKARVRREGKEELIDASELVIGDIVLLKSGNRVPADLRLIKATNLRIEESALTGESLPADKNVEPIVAGAGVGDRKNMAFSSSFVVAGRGLGVVTATGRDTQIGKINEMLAGVEQIATPLTQQMAIFGKLLSLAIVILAALMFALGWAFRDYSLPELFTAAIGFAVAAIPEGLPAVLTITLASGVRRMAQRNAITRKLPAVETLGSVTVICSDKTGTLTKNEMTVREVVVRGGQRENFTRYQVEGTGYADNGEVVDELGTKVDFSSSKHRNLRSLVELMEHCNEAAVSALEDGESDLGRLSIAGEPTEIALRVLARKAGLQRTGSGTDGAVASIPFESENKFMAVLVDLPMFTTDCEDPSGRDTERLILTKGAPDRLLDRCQYQLNPSGENEPLDRGFWEAEIKKMGEQGLRVLAAAQCRAAEDKKELNLVDLDQDLAMLGIVGILDPPRPEAIEAIETCRQAGITVKMITGDHGVTALAIGKEMSLTERDGVLTGEQIEKSSDDELAELAQQYDIFARTSPEHKLRLVKALQAKREVVAMTGDGVNDAPALKRADVGVAMGISGTEVTKEAAEIVLADDNFASIERAVNEGRGIYDNLRKAIVFILPTNGAQALVMFGAVLFGLTLPLVPVQILWVNMVTTVTLALALSFEPAEPGIMNHPPRKPGTPMLDLLLIWRIVFVSLLIGGASIGVFLSQLSAGREIDLARTVAVNTLVFGQIGYLFNARFLRCSSLRFRYLFTNPFVWGAVGLMLLLQLLFVYAPFMNLALHSLPMKASDWVIPVVNLLAVFVLVELEKLVVGNRRN